MTWHADSEVISSYVGGDLDETLSASIEAHVVMCTACQQALAAAMPADTDRLERAWSAVSESLDAPAPSPIERLLRVIGANDTDARLVATTPALTTSWLTAIVAAASFTLLPLRAGTAAAAMLLLAAPLLPLLAVAAAFTRRLDPCGELVVASPVSGLHLVLVRGIAVLVPALAALAVASWAAPDLPGSGVLLLPALALCACSVAASTWVEPLRAAGGLSVLWMAVVIGTQVRASNRFTFTAGNVLFQDGAQVILLAITVGAMAIAFARRQTFEFGR